LPTVIGTDCVDPRAAIGELSPFRSALAIGLRIISGTGLARAGSLDFTSDAPAGASASRTFCRMSTSRGIEVWLDILELQDGNPAGDHKVSRKSTFTRTQNLVAPDLQAASQLDRFLPLCPITSRYNVIPAGYETRLHADSSHEILVEQASARMRSQLIRRGLRKQNPSTKAPENPWADGKCGCVPVLFTLFLAARRVTETLCRAIER